QLLVIEGELYSSQRAALPRAILVDAQDDVRRPISVEGSPIHARIGTDGRQFAILTQEGNAFVYDLKTGQLKTEIDLNRRRVVNLAFSPDSRQLMVMHTDELSLWSLETGRELLRIPCSGSLSGTVTRSGVFADWNPFSPDGQWLITDAGQLRKWPRNPLQEALKQAPRPLSPKEVRQFDVNLLDEK
ncbi:MAG: hypothetical protein KDA85_14215, partial [Planctomycetaceae bacterium]|nr:hypothetical protein [Planctomycetaceae bacterium]